MVGSLIFAVNGFSGGSPGSGSPAAATVLCFQNSSTAACLADQPALQELPPLRIGNKILYFEFKMQ